MTKQFNCCVASLRIFMGILKCKLLEDDGGKEARKCFFSGDIASPDAQALPTCAVKSPTYEVRAIFMRNAGSQRARLMQAI
ncbi:hypothetical protein KCP73_23010 [Salmonella enterica subsp. enterica]|nr:hypothetical protein KCP73_23010 [Salmonella enterica subsp. enterica]